MRETTEERRKKKTSKTTLLIFSTLPSTAVDSHQPIHKAATPTLGLQRRHAHTHAHAPNPRHHASEVPSKGQTTCIRPIAYLFYEVVQQPAIGDQDRATAPVPTSQMHAASHPGNTHIGTARRPRTPHSGPSLRPSVRRGGPPDK